MSGLVIRPDRPIPTLAMLDGVGTELDRLPALGVTRDARTGSARWPGDPEK
jgi:hypothetical protein